MALNPNQLGEILSRSRQLCNPAADKMIDEHKSNGRLGEDIDPSQYHDKWDDWNYDDPEAMNEGKKGLPSMEYDSRSVKNSAMKPEILKSMMEQRIDTRTKESAALDAVTANLTKTRKPVNEERRQPVTEVASAPVGGLDYNYLKYIIKECLNEYFASNQLNESVGTLKQIGLSGGKIKLVDNKGNIYAANLELSGNIKDKKKGGN